MADEQETLTRGQKAAATRAKNRATKKGAAAPSPAKKKPGRKPKSVTQPTLIAGFDVAQPPIGSVVMAHGPKGTAFQRMSDGKYHSTTGKVVDFPGLLAQPNLMLVHSPS